MAAFQQLVEKTVAVGDLQSARKCNDKLRSFLTRKHLSKFYELPIQRQTEESEVYGVKIQEMPEAIKKEEELDGRYFIQTEVSKDVDKEEINISYKSLQKVEHAFRVLKGMLALRPVHVRKETRIRGHVMIVYIEKKLRELFPEAHNGDKEWIKRIRRNGDEPLSMMTLYEELDEIRLIPLQFKTNENKPVKTSYIATKIDANVKKLLSALGVKNATHPERLSFSRRETKGDGSQLALDLGIDLLS